MKLELHTFLPLLVRHLEQINPRHRAGDAQQRIDPTEFRQRSADDGFGGGRGHQVQIDDKRLGTVRPHLLGHLPELRRVSRGEDHYREIPSEPDCRGLADSGTRAGYDCYRL